FRGIARRAVVRLGEERIVARVFGLAGGVDPGGLEPNGTAERGDLASGILAAELRERDRGRLKRGAQGVPPHDLAPAPARRKAAHVAEGPSLNRQQGLSALRQRAS